MIEARSTAPLLPLRIFRLRTLSGSNVSGLLMGGAIFAQFFLLTLYMQQVLHYSALKTGLAYIGLTLTIIVFSALAQALVTRFGVRRCCRSGSRSRRSRSCCSPGCRFTALLQRPVPAVHHQRPRPRARVRADVDRRADGRAPRDAGVASGLINTTQQIGGAIGVAVATTVATTFTSHYVDAHPGARSARRADARLPGRVLRARRVAAVGAVLAALMLESKPG